MAFKFTEDTSHGLAKRIALFRMIQGEFPKSLYTPVSSSGYDFTYFDAFAGEGWYDKSIEGNEENSLQTPFGEARMGSPLVALYAIYQHIHDMNVESPNGDKKFFCMKILVVLEESGKGRIKKLMLNVLKFINDQCGSSDWNGIGQYKEATTDGKSFTMELKKDEINNIFYWTLTKAETVTINIQIEFKNSKFEDLDINGFKDNKPMISFIDPIGYSNTPMSKVMQLLGIRKKVLLNFMVHSVNRFKEVPMQIENFNNLFGDAEWKSYLPEEYREFDFASKMKSLVDCYTQCAGKFYSKIENINSSYLKFLNLSVRIGSAKGKDKGFIYYLVFMATDLNSIKTAKYALTNVAHNPALAEDINAEELFFSDHHDVNLLKAKTNDEQKPRTSPEQFDKEAQYIYKEWRGKRCTFGEVKEWILLETPLQIYSNAFRWLEKKCLLTVESGVYYQGRERVECLDKRNKKGRKPFYPQVNVDYDDPDPPTKKCRNGWVLKFADIEYQDAVPQPTPKKNKSKKTKGAKRKMEENTDETPSKSDHGNIDNGKRAMRNLFHEQ